MLLLLYLVSSGHIASPAHLKLITGKGTKKREIDVFERVQAIGYRNCQGHNFSGVDWGRKFIGITKKPMDNAYLKLDDNDPAIQCFKELGEGSIQSELINDELPIK